MGHEYKTVYSDSAYSQSFFNSLGQLWKTLDPDSVTNLIAYNAKGEQEYTAVDLDNNGQINLSGIDRVTRSVSDVVTNSALSANVRRTRTFVWSTNGVDAANLVSTAETSVDGLKSWNTIWNNGIGVTNKAQTVYAGSGNRYVTNTAPDGSCTISIFSNGRLISVTRKDSGNNQIVQTTYGYDAHGRQSSVTDARGGTTTYGFNDADQVTSVTTPNPGTLGGAPQTTLTYYNKSLQATNVVQPDGTSVTNEYYLTGLLKRTYGSRTYPVAYSYDSAGRMKTMTNWSTFSVSGAGTGGRVTTWNYNAYRGWLDSKDYPNATTGDPGTTGPDYTYTAAGRPASRTWARGVTTSYAYNPAGDLEKVWYSDGTPGVTNTYDRLGRLTQVAQGSMATARTYNDAGRLFRESYTGGPLDGLAVTNAYDSLLRRTAVALNTQPTTLTQFGYDNASRLQTVTAGTYNATYTYLANSPLVSQIAFKSNTVSRMTTTKQYDYLNRLSSISSVSSPPGILPVAFAHTYNDANQRTRATLGDLSYWVYGYDSLGQVISGKRYWFNGTPVAGQQFEYGFDDIGNRTQTKAGGDQNGANLRSATYAANLLNQYASRTVPGAVDVMGAALVGETVTVKSQSTYRKGEYFRKELSVANSSAPVWESVSVTAAGETPVSGNAFVPQTPESFTPDADGNLVSDGRWSYTWDAENRLVQVESLASGPVASKRKVVWEYDGEGRRIRQTTYDGSSGSYVVTEDVKFVCDGWRCIAELNAANNVLVRSYAWGLDLEPVMHFWQRRI